MVTITGYEKRENEKGEFFLLNLQGDVEIAFSKTTGLPYATSRRCSIPSTFDEKMCGTLIGRQLPGAITRVESDEYEYIIPETGETVTLNYQYVYSPTESGSMEHAVFGAAITV